MTNARCARQKLLSHAAYTAMRARLEEVEGKRSRMNTSASPHHMHMKLDWFVLFGNLLELSGRFYLSLLISSSESSIGMFSFKLKNKRQLSSYVLSLWDWLHGVSLSRSCCLLLHPLCFIQSQERGFIFLLIKQFLLFLGTRWFVCKSALLHQSKMFWLVSIFSRQLVPGR